MFDSYDTDIHLFHNDIRFITKQQTATRGGYVNSSRQGQNEFADYIVT